MNMKTIRMSNGRPVNIDFENWSTWAEATDFDDTHGRNVFQSYTSLHVRKRDGQEKYLVYGNSYLNSNNKRTTISAGMLVTDETKLTGAMRRVMDDLGLVVGHGDEAADYLLRTWEQDLPPVDLD